MLKEFLAAWQPLRQSGGRSRLAVRKPSHSTRRIRFDTLEERRLLAVLPVTTAADSGPGSLREAIQTANTLADVDQIQFAIPGTGVQSIALLSALPNLLQPVIIDGSTQPGYAGQPLIELNGASAGTVSGLTLAAGGTTIRGLAINRFAFAGIDIISDGNIIVANYLGTNPAGTAGLGNQDYGVYIDGSSQNTIGGTTVADRNLISGNDISGVYIDGVESTQNVVQGNYIGCDVLGLVALPNAFEGVEIFNGSNNLVGGTAVGAGNVISGNDFDGVTVSGPAATVNRIV